METRELDGLFNSMNADQRMVFLDMIRAKAKELGWTDDPVRHHPEALIEMARKVVGEAE